MSKINEIFQNIFILRKDGAMKRLTKKQNWFKQQNLTQKVKIYVGLDVHKKTISVAIWLNGL
jgi:hypothetical protein